MTDLFAQYAATAIPLSVQRKQAKAEKPKTKLDLRMEEKQRLTRNYRIARRNVNIETLASEPRLIRFSAWLRKQSDPREIVSGIAESWLPDATQDVKHYALRLVAARCDKLNRANGFAALDDPLPPETSVFFKVKEAIGAR